jgi:hypothetical protein
MLVTRFTTRLLGGICLATTLVARTAAAADADRLFAASVPGGAVRVLVVIGDGHWPAGGIRIEDASGAVLVARLDPDPEAAAALDAASQAAIATFRGSHAPSGGDATPGITLRALRVASDWTFARAVGTAVELPAALHPRSLRAVLLGAGGDVAATLGPVTVQADAGPPPPVGLHAEAGPAGITLRWQTGAHAAAVPAFAYSVERGVDGARDLITRRPRLLTLRKPGDANPFVDRAPPVETNVSYDLRLVDVLGVPSVAASVALYSPDFAASAPPSAQAASAARGFVVLTWKATDNPRVRGLVVERAQMAEGPYEMLTPDGLAPQLARFEDRQVLPGASYYYRVRAVTGDGVLGPAGDPVRAEPLAATALAAPQGLAAEAGASQVLLTWKPVAGLNVAGYIVERRAAANAARWARLNGRLDPEPRFVDAIGPGQGGSFDYRVTAVGTDEGVGKAGEIVHVTLIDSTPPAAPLVLAASGADGHVTIRFAAAEPAAKTARVALVRADAPSDAGLVVGAPVAAASGTIGDEWVHAGQVYWYRLVAFDAQGNRSAESATYRLRVAAVRLPTPKAPVVAYTATPAPRATLTFDAPPPHVRVLVEVARDDGRYRTVAGPMTGTSAVDPDPPGPHPTYRLVYVGESGGAGIPSAVASPR